MLVAIVKLIQYILACMPIIMIHSYRLINDQACSAQLHEACLLVLLKSAATVII